MADDSSEARRHTRQALVTFAWFQRVDDAASPEDHGIARSCDISLGGIGMMVARSLPVGARLFLELVSQPGRLCVMGKVMHCSSADNGLFRVGIQVDLVPPGSQRLWRRTNSS